MDFDQSDMHELTRKATDLMSETADIARLLKVRLGVGHHLSRCAGGMLESMESLVRELRSFCASARSDRAGLFDTGIEVGETRNKQRTR